MRRSLAKVAAVAPDVALFGHRRRDLPLWLWRLQEGAFVAFRPGYWPAYRGVAFGRVLADATARGPTRAEDRPHFSAEVWFPLDPFEPGVRQLSVLSTRSVLRYVSEREATTMLALPTDWLTDPEPQPLPADVLAAIFDSEANAGV